MCKRGNYKKVKLCNSKNNLKKYAWVDKCIYPIIEALNKANIRTRASCCGHEKLIGNIMLSDGRELFITKDYKTARKLENWFFKHK